MTGVRDLVEIKMDEDCGGSKLQRCRESREVETIEIINRDFEEDFLKISINFIGLQYLTVVFKWFIFGVIIVA